MMPSVESFHLSVHLEVGPLTGTYLLRLEVGTAHRYVVDETMQLSNQTLIMQLIRFVHAAPVGGAHL